MVGRRWLRVTLACSSCHSRSVRLGVGAVGGKEVELDAVVELGELALHEAHLQTAS